MKNAAHFLSGIAVATAGIIAVISGVSPIMISAFTITLIAGFCIGYAASLKENA